MAAQVREDAVTVACDAETPRPTGPRPRRASAPLVTGNRYELGAVIGRGGMGEVVAAYDSQVGREVAIKRMNAEQPTAAQLSRFLREARIQGRLEHPSIPPVHELGADDDGRPFFVMTKLSGVTLAEVLRDPNAHVAFSRQRLLGAFVDVCRAIELAHARGILHRDLKPSNVLLGDHGEVYVLDWGIARELGRRDATGGDKAGTPSYMSPEHARGVPDLDARADVYSLGCVLHEILTGATRNPRRAGTARGDVPPELELLVDAATATDRDRRIGSARELADAVQRYLDGDRDLAHRRDLARQHLIRAEAALDSAGLDEVRRRTAMREAGRALALDPTLEPAAQLVSRLMLEPPVETPRAVTEELAAMELGEDVKQLRVISRITIAYLAFIPLLYALGIRDTFYMSMFALLSLLNVGGQRFALRNPRYARLGLPYAIALAIAMTVLLARMWSPFFIAPSFVATNIMGFSTSSHARGRRTILWICALSFAAIVGTYAAEAVGLVSHTTWTEGDTLFMRAPLSGSAHFPIIGMTILYLGSMIAAAGSFAWTTACLRHRSKEQLQVQSWQLRQLLH